MNEGMDYKMEIRKGTIKDFDDIYKLQLQLEETECNCDQNLAHYYATNEGKENLKKRIRRRKTILYVAIENNKIVGFIDGYIMKDAAWYKEQVAYLDHICVDENYRKQGIGNLLIETFQNRVKKDGAKYIRLLAFLNNIPTITFYENRNFNTYSVYYNKSL